MNKKKDGKAKSADKEFSSNLSEESRGNGAAQGEKGGDISSKQELKVFLNSIRDKMTDNTAAPLYAMSAMNHVMSLSNIYDLLDNENKEIARDVWLRINQSGLQIRMPSILFSVEEIQSGSKSVA